MERRQAMPTDEERREVARRLRGDLENARSRGHYCNDSETVRYICDILGLHCSRCPHPWAGVEALADLIEPSESGQNRDRNQDSVQKESHIVQIDHECDRDALLKLADDLDGMGDGSMYDPCISDEYGIASRIREILGV